MTRLVFRPSKGTKPRRRGTNPDDAPSIAEFFEGVDAATSGNIDSLSFKAQQVRDAIISALHQELALCDTMAKLRVQE